MLKKLLIVVAAMGASLVAFQPTEKAEARVNVDVYIPGPYYYPRRRYYPPRYYYVPRRRYYRRYSCAGGRRIVRRHGFYNIRTIRCGAENYVYHAKKRGLWWRMNVRARTGSLYAVRRLY